MKVLVTGGAGFIGSHLVDALLARGDEVVVLDDLSAGSVDNIAESSSLLSNGSTSIEPLVSALVSQSDCVFHLASPVGVMRVLEQPDNVLRSMLDGTANVVSACVAHNKPLVFTSSSEVYGTAPAIPTREYEPLMPGPPDSVRWHYAMGKATNEHQIFAARQQYGLKCVVVRLFNTAGPRQSGRYGMVIPRFVEAALRGEPLTVFGNGTQTRSFAHVSDVVHGLVVLSECDKADGLVVNLGSDQEISIRALAARIVELLKSKSEIQYMPHSRAYSAEFGEVAKRVPDLTRAEALIGYEPTKDLDDIILDVAKEHE